MKFHFSPATGCGPRIVPERNFLSQREPLPYTELLRVAQGCNAKRATLGLGRLSSLR